MKKVISVVLMIVAAALVSTSAQAATYRPGAQCVQALDSTPTMYYAANGAAHNYDTVYDTWWVCPVPSTVGLGICDGAPYYCRLNSPEVWIYDHKTDDQVYCRGVGVDVDDGSTTYGSWKYGDTLGTGYDKLSLDSVTGVVGDTSWVIECNLPDKDTGTSFILQYQAAPSYSTTT